MNAEDYASKEAYYKLVRKTCFISDLIFVLSHISYMVFFLVAEVYCLAYVNLGSTILYLVLAIFIKKKMYNVYVVTAGIEIGVFMSLCTVLCGFAPGFHLCLIGLCILVFFSSYFSANGKKVIKPNVWSIALAVDYLFLYFWCYFNGSVYELSEVFNSILFVGHIIVVFSFTASFLTLFTHYVIKLEKRILRESRTDNLTQIPNRNGLYDYINSLSHKEQYVLAIVDIDNFKNVNDENGHICGDYMLKELATLVKDNLGSDFVSRFGGEEFIVLLNDDVEYEEIIKKLDRIREMVEAYEFVYKNKRLHTTITIGVAKYSNLPIDDWITEADKKLYIGKNSGKNQVVM